MAIDAGTVLAAFDLDTSGFDGGMNHAATALSNFGEGAHAEAIENVEEKIQDVGEAAEEAAEEMEELADPVQTEAVGNLETAFSKLGKTVAALKIGEKLMEIGQSVVTTGMNFDSQMSRVKAIAGATDDEFEKLRQTAIDLGASTTFSGLEAAEGMENLASAGFSTNEIIAAMPGMLDLAAASGESLATSAGIAASTLRGFGLNADQAGHVADVLAENAARTNAAVYDTGEAMKYVAPMANAMGLSLEEVTAAIGIMSDAGIMGSQAGTTLRGALSRLAKPTEDMSTVMKELGLDFYDSGGNMKSLESIIGMLDTKMAGLTNEQKQNALVTLFGQEALSGIMVLMEAGSGKLGDLTEAYQSCDGAAADMAATMTDNLGGDVEALTGSLETAAQSIYDKFEPALRAGVQAATGLVDAFNAEGITGVFNTIVEAAQSIEWPGIATTIMDGVTSVLGKAGEFLSGIFSAGKDATQELPWEEVGASVQGGVNSVIDTGGAFLSSAFTAAKTAIEGIGWGDVGSKISSGLAGALDTLGRIGGSIWDTITGWFSDDDEESAQADAEAMMDGLETGITGSAGAVATAASTAASGVSTAMTNVLNLEGGTAIAASWMNGLSTGITTAQATLTTNAQTVADATKLVMDTTFSAANGTTIGTVFMAGISSGLTTSSSTLSSNATTVASAAVTAASGEMSFSAGSGIGMNMVLGMAAGVRNGSSSLNSAIRSVARSAVAAARSALKINSPSGVFEDEVGAWIPSGVGVGVTNNMQDALGPIEEMRDGMVSMMDGTLSGVNLGRPKAPWDGGSYAGSSTININITGDWSVRSDEDRREIISELYERISEEMRRR